MVSATSPCRSTQVLRFDFCFGFRFGLVFILILFVMLPTTIDSSATSSTTICFVKSFGGSPRNRYPSFANRRPPFPIRLGGSLEEDPATETDIETETATNGLSAIPGNPSSVHGSDNNHNHNSIHSSSNGSNPPTKRSFRKRVKRLTKKIVPWTGPSSSTTSTTVTTSMSSPQLKAVVDEAFGPAEDSLRDMEEALRNAKAALATAKLESYRALEALDTMGRTLAPERTVPTNGENDDDEDEPMYTELDLDSLTFEDIDYESSEMAPPFLDQDSCLMPDAEPLVRVEKAPDNSRRIFAGIDILASAEDVWNILTEYDELQNVIPNLVVNDILDLYDGDSSAKEEAGAEHLPEEVRCANLSKTMKGSLLRQVGGAKVAGINFSAKTTLEVREWPNGMPDFAHFLDDMWEGKSREERAREYPKIKLKRYRFPRPFAVSKLPTRDISMQSVENDDGEFRLYQGVWRMQPLVGCSPPGKDAMRLTYAVEISPRVYLPVKLIEGRIVRDLCANLEAIREAVSTVAID